MSIKGYCEVFPIKILTQKYVPRHVVTAAQIIMNQENTQPTIPYPVLSWSGMETQLQCFKFNWSSKFNLHSFLYFWKQEVRWIHYYSYQARHPHFFHIWIPKVQKPLWNINLKKQFPYPPTTTKKKLGLKQKNLVCNFF